MLLALAGVVPGLFTDDAAVVERARAIWPLFALAGILSGAGDTRHLEVSMVVAGFGAYVPVALAAMAFDWGIVGVCCGLLGLMAVRLVTLGVRFRGRRWAVTGS